MTRAQVIQLMREAGDAFLRQAQESGVEPDELFKVYFSSLCRGVDRINEHGERIAEAPHLAALEPEEGAVSEFSHLRAAIVQTLTAASLLLEMMPMPEEEEFIHVFGRDIGRPN